MASHEYYMAHKAEYKENRNRYRRKRTADIRAFLQVLKEETPCTDCHNHFPHYIMEFDHVRGIKKYNVACMTSQKWHIIMSEVAKCDVVCANCHNTRTWFRHLNGNNNKEQSNV